MYSESSSSYRRHHSTPTVTRTGRVGVKRTGFGLTPWKGYKEKWLVLKYNTLIAYKDSNEAEVSFSVPLDSLRKLEHQGQRCISLTTRGSTQYHLSFATNSQLVDWCSDIHDLSTYEGFIPKEVDDTEGEFWDSIIEDYVSPTSDSSHEIYPWDDNPAPPNHPTSRQSLAKASSTEVKLQPKERNLIRQAITILCHSMEPRLLRTSDPGGTKSFDLVELRLRPLLRLKRKWKKQTHVDELDTEETRAFSEALLDGYVLCQLFNTLHSSPIIRPDVRDTVNVAKFRAHCIDCGLSHNDIFQLGDIEEASASSLTRVARTITTLVKLVAESTLRTATRNALVKYSHDDEAHGTPGPEISLVEIWVDKFISTRLAKPGLQFDPDSEFAPKSGVQKLGLKSKTDNTGSGGMKPKVTCSVQKPKIYQHLFLLVADVAAQCVSRQINSLKRGLDNLYRFMACLDLTTSLVESRQYRLRLLQISAELQLKPVENRRLRDALRKDDEHIAQLLGKALESDGDRELILGLQGEDAQNCVDLIQDVLDKASPSELGHASVTQDDAHNAFKHQAQRLLVKLSEAQDILPASLFIKGVRRYDSEAYYGGTFGDIYRARYRSEDVALKRIRVFQNTTDRHKVIRGLCREALLWRTLKHPYVLPFRGMDDETFSSLLCLVSPWMKNGTILKHLRDTGCADIEQRIFEIAQGLAYLHSQHIIHGDLRGSNILVDDEWHARLADFGLAVFSDATVGTNSSHHAGSVRWMAPELHLPQSFDLKYFRRTFASDVYSFACVCVELYSGKPPFADIPHDPAALLRVMEGIRPSRPSYPSSNGTVQMPDYLWEIVQLCWSHNRAERPCMTKVVAMMQAGNEELVPVVPPPTEVFDGDVTLHGLTFPGQSGLVRGSRNVRRKNRSI